VAVQAVKSEGAITKDSRETEMFGMDNQGQPVILKIVVAKFCRQIKNPHQFVR
jgi:hypothetical protein